jgi:hypothetical protein
LVGGGNQPPCEQKPKEKANAKPKTETLIKTRKTSILRDFF